ncbi:EXS family-domain-containing protein [Sporodiniella umbellata]|nr:EXS family-domain-containing protein [Sporodiniella umbellata]
MAILTCPFPILYASSRRWLCNTLGRIVFSYCFPVEFRDFFIADELNSLAYSFWTISYFFCAYVYHWLDFGDNCPVKLFWFTPFLASLPPWWRLLQCLRRYKDSKEKVHLVNGLKYVTSILAALVTGFRRMHNTLVMDIIWIVCCTISSIYTSAWDVKMDWGLLENKSKHFLLRDDLVFYKWVNTNTYYLAMPINILLRFAWTLNILITSASSDTVSFMVALLEVYRRIQWNFFRLEKEHINNCGNYHAIKEIPLPFAFSEISKTFTDQEEGRIQLPVDIHSSHASAIVSTEPIGSFYGRRDFENKPDLDEKQVEVDLAKSLNHKASKVGLVLESIRSRTLDGSGTEEELEEDDDDDEDDSD